MTSSREVIAGIIFSFLFVEKILSCDINRSTGTLSNCSANELRQHSNWDLKRCTLQIEKSYINTFSADLFNEFGYSYVHYVILKNLNIHNVSDGAFQNFPYCSTLDLSFNKIEVITSQAFELELLHILDLSHNKIERISDESFNLGNLGSINLAHNRLGSIPVNAFCAAKNLITLDLTHNKIRVIEGNNSNVSCYLQTLDVSHNEIVTIFPEAFHNWPSLLHLNLSYNAITKISHGTFNGLNQLRVLNMSHNQLELTSETFDHLSSLEILDLAFNNVTIIPRGAFDTFKSLIYLNISHNRLIHLEEHTFLMMHHLMYFNVDDNQIATFQPINFSNTNLREIYVNNNPWNCKDLQVLHSTVIKQKIQLIKSVNHRTTNVNGIACNDVNITVPKVTQAASSNEETSTRSSSGDNESTLVKIKFDDQIREELGTLLISVKVIMVMMIIITMVIAGVIALHIPKGIQKLRRQSNIQIELL